MLAVYSFYAMSQAVMPKASTEAISIEVGLLVGVLLVIMFINYNKIISGIQNVIPSPSSLQYVIKKAREATFKIFQGLYVIIPEA